MGIIVRDIRQSGDSRHLFSTRLGQSLRKYLYTMLGNLSEAEIADVLRGNMLCRIACIGDNEIYIVPVTYIYENSTIICHAFEGKKLSLMRKHPRVGIEVEAISDHQNWKCVTGQGLFEEITDDQYIAMVKKRLSESALSRKASLTSLPPSESPLEKHPLKGASVFYKIHLSKLTGRFEKSLNR
jgi:nitroimidazol reductase NimA-like FMN-containing flavoprotein (pyridoxamine 5'-phosphate oxidase superfamily)